MKSIKINNFYGNHSTGAAFDKMGDNFFSKKIFYITKIIKKNSKKNIKVNL